MEHEKDSVTKVFASAFAILAIAGVILTVVSGVWVHQKRTKAPEQPCIVDLGGPRITRAEVWGNKTVCEALRRLGGVSVPPDATHPLASKQYHNQCHVEVLGTSFFTRTFRSTCLVLNANEPLEVLETNSSTEIVKHIRNFHRKKTS